MVGKQKGELVSAMVISRANTCSVHLISGWKWSRLIGSRDRLFSRCCWELVGVRLWYGWKVVGLESRVLAAGRCSILCLGLALADQILCLLGVLVGVALERFGGSAGLLNSDVADLGSLSRGKVLGVVQLCVNELLVLKVYKRSKEKEDICNQGEAPEWHELDQEVGDEG